MGEEKGLKLREGIQGVNDISYRRYQELGGIINEQNYQCALTRASETIQLSGVLIAQADLIARVAGITLDNADGCLDVITILYGVLRTDSKPGAQYHHSQMCDQRLFAEALRMLDCPILLAKVIEAHPNICFV